MKTNLRIQLYPMLRLALFIIVGIVVGEKTYGQVSSVAWFSAFALFVAAALLLRRYGVAQSVALFLASAFIGGCLTVSELSSVGRALPGRGVGYSAVIVGSPEAVGKTVRCDAIVTGIGRPFKVKASFLRDNRAESLKPGYGIKAFSAFERPAGYPGADFDYGRYLLYHGYSATTFIRADEWRLAAVSLRDLPLLWRVRISALAFRAKLLDDFRRLGFSGNGYAVLTAMTLGERVSMPDSLIDDYSVSGALHVLSLSGLHLGIIYSILSFVFLRRRRRLVVQVTVVCAVWAYVFIVGLPVSAVRSAVMLTLCSFTTLLNRDNMSPNSLALAAVAVLLCSPLNLYDVGFQMSFVSVLFIVLLYRPLYSALPGRAKRMFLVRDVCSMTIVSVVAQIGVAPLVAFYFGRFSCYFLLANFVVIPVSFLILCGAVLVVCTGWVPWFQELLCRWLSWLVDFMNAGVTFVASLPGASVEGVMLNFVQLAMVYVAVASVCILVTYLRKMRSLNAFKKPQGL